MCHAASSRRAALRLALLVAPSCVGACAPGEDASATCTPAGDATSPAVVGLVENDTQGGLLPLTDGAEVHLRQPLQGGHVIFVGAVVTGLCTDSVLVTGRVFDAATGALIAEETRRGFGLVERADGTAAPDSHDLGAVANVALCPVAPGEPAAAGRAVRVEVTVSDADGRTAQGVVNATLVCDAADPAARAACACDCAAEGEAPDAGTCP